MAMMFDRIAAKIAYWHATGVYSRFSHTLRNISTVQNAVLKRVLARMAGSEYACKHDLASVRSHADLKKSAPLVTYDDLHPYIERLCAGDTSALFAPNERIHMFATSSGTTARQKLIPVTSEFVRQYRRGWNTFGLKLLNDHPRAVLRAILQCSGRHDERHTPAGVPCGAITGLLAHTQKRIVRRYYAGVPEISLIDDPHARYYTLMRFAIIRDVAFAVTANPATLIRLAQTANDESERMLRDVRDGTLSRELVPDAALCRRLERRLRADPERAHALEKLRSSSGALRPRDYWQLEFLACWTGGSMGYYLQRLADWWGPVPIRDVGLLASEGRVSIPLEDGTPAGVLDPQSAFFEFIPADQWDRPNPQVYAAQEVEAGKDYTVVLTNDAGLVRYRLDDVVRVRGWVEQAPLLEFLHRAGRVASIAGEKLTEHQAVQAVEMAKTRLGLQEFDFLLTPQWGDPPFYLLSCTCEPTPELAEAVDLALSEQNAEYGSRRKSFRLGSLQLKKLPHSALTKMDQKHISRQGATAEQYKRTCLFTTPNREY